MSDVERIREHIETERKRFSVPGCAVVVVARGEVLLAAGFGTRNVAEGEPVTAETLFPIGSATKTFTAALCASLVEEGRLDLDQPVRELMPGFRLQDPVATELLSIRDCLAHRSGLPRHDMLWYAGEGQLSRDDLVAALPYLAPLKPFRQSWQYNNLLYTLAGHLAGRLHGTSYEDAVQQRLLEPLGMDRTNFRVAEVEKDADRARPYALNDDGIVQEVPYAHLNLAGPAGCINSCVRDLSPWLFTLLGLGVDGRPQLLSDALLDEIRTNAMPRPATQSLSGEAIVGYGLGVVIDDYRGHRVLHHGGNIDGFSSQVAVIPKEGIGVAVLTNLGGTPLRDVLPYVIVDELLGLDDRKHGEAHFALWDSARAGVAQGRAREKETSQALAPVRPLGDYTGRYSHPGYGAVSIDQDGERLCATYGRLRGPLEHRHLEVFQLVLEQGATQQRIPVQFTHDLEADVDSLLLSIEPALPPQRFARQPDTSHLTDELLDRFAGTYVLDAFELLIARRGPHNLLISAAGGAPDILTPLRDTTFTWGGMRYEFTADGRLITPYGEFARTV